MVWIQQFYLSIFFFRCYETNYFRKLTRRIDNCTFDISLDRFDTINLRISLRSITNIVKRLFYKDKIETAV